MYPIPFMFIELRNRLARDGFGVSNALSECPSQAACIAAKGYTSYILSPCYLLAKHRIYNDIFSCFRVKPV
jgi:hypothetical protein